MVWISVDGGFVLKNFNPDVMCHYFDGYCCIYLIIHLFIYLLPFYSFIYFPLVSCSPARQIWLKMVGTSTSCLSSVTLSCLWVLSLLYVFEISISQIFPETIFFFFLFTKTRMVCLLFYFYFYFFPKAEHRTMAAFVLAVIVNNYPPGQVRNL